MVGTNNGMATAAVLQSLQERKAQDVDYEAGKLFGLSFVADDAGRQLAEDAYKMYMWTNALDPMLYPSLMAFEKDVLTFAAHHLGGDPATTVGTFTSGGTESCLLAVKAARDWARDHRPDVTRPVMILPVTAHPAFHKAAAYFGLETVVTAVDPVTCQADPGAMRAAITDQTILLVASATSFAHGALDPIESIAAIAQEHELLFHVDGCIGGFLLPFWRELGVDVPAFDFSVPGVTSMSMDFHKYAYAPKGASVVLYRNPELRRYQVFTHSAWPGYTMVNPVIQSSRSGGPLAATWALLQHYGRDGYRAIAQTLKTTTDRLIAGINAIDGVHVAGTPIISLLAIGTEGFSCFALCDALAAKGWHVQAGMGVDNLPATFHLTVMPRHAPQIEAFLLDLAACVAEVRQLPASGGELMGMLSAIDLAEFNDGEIEELLQSSGLMANTGISQPMAEVNQILDSLPTTDTDRLVASYYDLMSRPVVAAP